MKEERTKFIQEYEKLMSETIIPTLEEFDKKTQPIKELIKVNIPTRLFRFRACTEYSLDAFWRDLIFHSKPNSFNDPHDCLVYIDKNSIINKIKQSFSLENMKSILDSWHKWEQQPDSFFSPYSKTDPIIQEFAQYLTKKTAIDLLNANDEAPNKLPETELEYIKELGFVENGMYTHFRSYPKIACFSESILSNLMWAHYADFHKGFALEYDFTQEQSKCLGCQKTCNNFAVMNLYPIIYREERYDATELANFMLKNELLKKIGFLNNNNIPDNFAYTKANLYKGLDWEYEKEWRSILSCPNNPDNHKVEVKAKAIYLGANIAPVFQNILTIYALEKNIRIYKMSIAFSAKENKLAYFQLN